MQAASDATIWKDAHVRSTTIITKDEDFARRRTMASKGPAVVWLRLPNTWRRHLLVWFAAVLPDISTALAFGETLVEVT